MDGLTTAAQTYMTAFGSYINVFLGWGQWLFFSLLTMNLIWLFLWNAFDRDSIVDSMGQFIRKFFVIALFYTIMLHHDWLLQILQSAQIMGGKLTGAQTDPSSIISQGIGIANKVIQPVEAASILTFGLGELVAFIVYLVVLFVFISIALQLALTLIITTALITVSTFFLGFAALSSTTQVARNTLDAILASCIKLLGLYLVIAAGSKTITTIVTIIPVKLISFDPYAWIVATTLLFWLLAKNLPDQLAKIFTGVLQEHRGADAAAIAMALTQYARMATGVGGAVAGAAAGVAGGVAKTAGSSLYNAASHYQQARTEGLGRTASTMKAGVGTAGDAVSSAKGSISDHFSHLASKSSGGSSTFSDSSKIPGFASRMNQSGAQRFESLKPQDETSSQENNKK